MSATRFLSNDSLWSELQTRVKAATSVRAAVAFVGSGGADLLPLKKGDTLVVNMGIQTVRQGLTAPKEVRKLLRRKVRVFTRSTLHAKFFLFSRALLVGSANVSHNSKHLLDEAASLTTDSSAIRRAAAFFEQLCSEPVRPEYLKVCLRAYRPPVFGANGPARTGARQKRAVEAKVWFIGGLRYGGVPEAEEERVERITEQAAKQLQKPSGTSVYYTHYPTEPGYFSHIRVGDWVVECFAERGGERFVGAPQQVLDLKSYRRGGGKSRHLLLSEAPNSGQEMPLAQFRRRVRRIVPKLDTDRPRTMAVESVESADAILRLWTAAGRVAKKQAHREAGG